MEIALVSMYLIFLLIMGIFGIVVYVLESLGVYTIAARRTIKHPWLAWLPIGSAWVLGCISDQYQYVAKGRVKNRRKVLLVLSILGMILGIVAGMMAGGLTGQVIVRAIEGAEMTDDEIMEMLFTPMMSIWGLSMVSGIFAIVRMVFTYIALYDVYTSCDPSSSVLFLILSIFFSVARPFILFALRKKDLGMPPRKPQIPTWQNGQGNWQPQQPPVQSTWQPVQPPQPQQWQPVQPPQDPWNQPQQQDPWNQPQPPVPPVQPQNGWQQPPVPSQSDWQQPPAPPAPPQNDAPQPPTPPETPWKPEE